MNCLLLLCLLCCCGKGKENTGCGCHHEHHHHKPCDGGMVRPEPRECRPAPEPRMERSFNPFPAPGTCGCEEGNTDK